MSEDPKKSGPTSKDQENAASKKNGPADASRQQTPEKTAEVKPGTDAGKAASAPSPLAKDPGKPSDKDGIKETAQKATPPSKGISPPSPATAPTPPPPGKAAPSAPTKSALPDKPKPETPAQAPSPAKAETPGRSEPPGKPAASPTPGADQPAAEPWKSSPVAAAAPGMASPPRPEAQKPGAGSPMTGSPGAGATSSGSEKKTAESEKRTGGAGGAPRPGGPADRPPPSTPAAKRRWGCLPLIALAAILLAAALLTSPWWSRGIAPYVQNYLPAAPSNGQTAALEERIAALEQTVRDQPVGEAAVREEDLAALEQEIEAVRRQVDALSERLQDVEPGVAAVPPEQLDERLSELRSEREQLVRRVGDIDGRLASLDDQVGGIGEQVNRLDDRMNRLGERVDGRLSEVDEQVRNLSQQMDTSHGVAAIALGLSRLSETLGTSRAYREELDALKNASDQAVLDEESMQVLEAYAEFGVPTFADLYRRFPEMADAVARAEADANAEGPLETAFNRLRSLVSVRRTGEAALAAGGVDAALEVARNRMEAADLPGAIDAIAQLEGAAAQAAAWWIDGARSRLAVQRAMERVQVRAIATLSSQEG